MGKAIVLRTNYFPLKLLDDKLRICRYQIDFPARPGKNALSKKKKRRYIELLLDQAPFNQSEIASDYSAMLLSSKELFKESGVLKFQVTLWERLEDPLPAASPNDSAELTQARQRKTLTIEVKFVKGYSISELFRFVNGKTTYADTKDAQQAVNIVLQRYANRTNNISNAGQNDMYPFGDDFEQAHQLREVHDLGQGLVAHRGYFSSVRLGPQRVLVNIQGTTRAMYKSGNAADLIQEFFGRRGSDNRSLRELSVFLRGVRVLTKYTGKPKVCTIWGLASKPKVGAYPSEVKFKQKDETGKEREITIARYFQQKYNIALPQHCVLNCGTGNEPRYVPSNLCIVLGGQPARRLLAEDQTREILRFAARRPNVNAASIASNGLKVLGVDEEVQKNTIGRFGLSMGTDMLTVPARILPAPRIHYAGQHDAQPYGGSWNLNNVKFHTACTISLAAILVLTEGTAQPYFDIGSLGEHIKRQFGQYRLQILNVLNLPTRQIGYLSSIAQDSSKAVETLSAAFKQAQSSGIKLLVISIPRKHAKLYAIIKKLGDVVFGIHTIVLQQQNMEKVMQDPTLTANIALKACAKFGGLCWTPDAQALKPFDADTMLVGIDVTHPSPGSAEKAPSIAAVCASYDAWLTGYPGDVVRQGRRQEMVEGLKELMIKRLKFFQLKNNKRLPKKIIVYRDGVSEGQFSIVLNTEFTSMKEAFDSLYGKQHPKVTIIVVGKRHHTRFYPTSTANIDPKSKNTVPGTAVDRHITGYGERVWDFFLQPHKALQGTAKPMHCIVIKNECGFGVDIERMTHTLCYLWHRATKAVSIPPPAYYADKLAERGRMYLHDIFTDDVSDTASQASTQTAGSLQNWDRGVHPNIENTMFYI